MTVRFRISLAPLLIFLAAMMLIFGHSQLVAQTGYVWAKGIQGSGFYDFGLDADCDAQGNIFICGDYEGPSNFGGSIYAGLGSSDMYTCRLSPEGQFEWVSRQGSADTERNFSLAIGPDKHIYTCGYGKVPYPRPQDHILHQWDAITTRIRPDGSVHWGRAMQGDVYSEGNDIAADAVGNSYTVGEMKIHGWYGSDTILGHGLADAFVVKLDSSGNFIWGRSLGGSQNDLANSVALDPQGNIWVAGSFRGTAQFGGLNLTSSGGSDAFIAQLSPNGNVLMAKAFTGSSDAEIQEIAISPDGSCYFVGQFAGTIGFPNQNLSAADTLDVFYGKMDLQGNVIWAKKAGGFDLDFSQDLAIDSEENLYIGGFFFGDFNWQGTTVTSTAFDDMYFAKTDSNGILDFLEVSHSLDSRDVFGIGVDPAQNVIVTGSFSDSMYFGATSLYSSGFNKDIFVAKYATRAPALKILGVLGSPYCSGDGFKVPFQAWGHFPTGNAFSLELSDLNGNFSNSIVIGTYVGSYADTIQASIPLGIPSGTQYRVRIRASLPNTVISPDNGFDITLTSTTSIPVEIMGDTVICNNPVVLSVDPGFVSQQWSTGDTSRVIFVASPGIVSVEATDAQGCSNYDAVNVVVCASALSSLPKTRLQLIPNPANQETQLIFDPAEAGIMQLVILNVQGQVQMQTELNLPNGRYVFPIDVSSFAAGIYLLKLNNNQSQQSLRLLIR